MNTFVISCGGTGGHLSPGIALTEALIEEGHICKLVISDKQVDARLIQKYNTLEYVKLPGRGFSLNPISFIRFNIQQVRAFIYSLNLLRKYQPDGVIGFGGFITASVVLAAFILGIPVILHESNRKPGKAIRLLSGFAQRIYLPEGVRLKGIPPSVVRHCGFPLRKEICHIKKDEVRQRLGVPLHQKVLLVFGGSQGAISLNTWVQDHFTKLAEEGISVYCLTGPSNEPLANLEHRNANGHVIKAIFEPFAENMAELLSMADLVISRAGAGSIAEIIRCRVPAILVPYPHAADDHQHANAAFHEKQGAGVTVRQAAMDKLFDEVIDTIYNDWLLDRFRRNLERLDRTISIDVVIRDIVTIAEKHAADK